MGLHTDPPETDLLAFATCDDTVIAAVGNDGESPDSDAKRTPGTSDATPLPWSIV